VHEYREIVLIACAQERTRLHQEHHLGRGRFGLSEQPAVGMQLFNRTRLIAGLADQVDEVAGAGLCHTATSCWLLRVGFISSKTAVV
jgi:hypothetical protein